jgi:hypothetical protein
MRRHVLTHGSIKTYPSTPTQVQAIFESNMTYYPVTVPSFSTAPLTQPSASAIAEAQYRAVFDLQPELEDRAHLSPFLATYDWVPIVSPLSPRQIREWVALPGENEPKLSGLISTAKAYYNLIVKEMGNLDQHTTVLRWIKSSKT